MTSKSYRGFNVRPRFTTGGDTKFWKDLSLAKLVPGMLGRQAASGFEDFRGVTNDGTVRPDLFGLMSTGLSMSGPIAAAEALISLANTDERKQMLRPMDSGDARNWMNGLEMPQGLRLRSASRPQRDATMNLVRASLSSHGYEQVWAAMRLNEVLGEIVGDTVALNTWNYSISIFGTPSRDQPWGWQLQGHHVVVNYFVIGDQVVVTPQFIGAEPAIADDGPLKGLAVLQEEGHHGFEMIHALDDSQRRIAVVGEDIMGKDLPPGRVIMADERVQAGGFMDNAIIPYEGLAAAQMTSAQQRRLMKLVDIYVSRMPADHARLRMSEIEKHMDETHFAWIGKSGDTDPFYYKVHSPVILIEFDHHCGVLLDNDRPEKFHVHTQVRTPNGNDYGRDLLRQHYEEQHKSRHHPHDHAHGPAKR
jgi:Protein of unknown function (DUF3500)